MNTRKFLWIPGTYNSNFEVMFMKRHNKTSNVR